MRKLKKLIASLVVIAIVIAAAVIFIPRLTHNCDHCAEFFVGTGYYANVLTNAFTSLAGEEDKVLCKDCAAKEHALAIATGKSLTDFQRPLFEEKED